ncbi:hypothetical protein Q3G72_026194 [Acer saccharum]|nr:hypothetical protein Q3G72_026194 [Acer saccharum]
MLEAVANALAKQAAKEKSPSPTKRTFTDQERATDSHHEFLGSFMGCKEKAKQSIFYSYNKHINGFAARLEEKEAEEIAKKGSDIPLNSLWKKARFGDGIIIGNMDTGGKEDAEPFESGLQIGAFHAMKHGIPVVAGAGNSGPAPSTIRNSAPWLITAEDAMVPNALVAIAEDDQNSCNAKNIQMDLNKLKGKILVCINKKQKATSHDISSLQPAAGANKDES